MPLGMVIQLSVCSKSSAFRHRSPALLGHAGASLSAQGLCPARRGLPPSDSSPRASAALEAAPHGSTSAHEFGLVEAWRPARKRCPKSSRDAVQRRQRLRAKFIFVTGFVCFCRAHKTRSTTRGRHQKRAQAVYLRRPETRDKPRTRRTSPPPER